jgi:RNA polymerase sigma-70 factor (ECF subfamily)
MIVIVLPDIPAEDRLLSQARQGNHDALMRIYESYFPPIFNFIRLRVDDLTLAEDMASDVFVKLVEALRGKNAPQHSLRGWLFRVARNQIADHYGRSRNLTTEALEEWIPTPDEHDPEMHFMRSHELERTRRALRMMADDQQEVLLLRFGQSLSLQETADLMGRSTSAIKSLQFRAVNTLRQILGEVQVENHG